MCDWRSVNVPVCVYVCVCVCVSACMCLLQAMHRKLLKSSSSTWHGDCLRHENASRDEIILTLAFIQGHTDFNHENYIFLILSEYYSSNANHFCSEDSPTKGLYDRCQSDNLDLHSKSQVCLKLDYFFNLQHLGQYLSYYLQS